MGYFLEDGRGLKTLAPILPVPQGTHGSNLKNVKPCLPSCMQAWGTRHTWDNFPPTRNVAPFITARPSLTQASTQLHTRAAPSPGRPSVVWPLCCAKPHSSVSFSPGGNGKQPQPLLLLSVVIASVPQMAVVIADTGG